MAAGRTLGNACFPWQKYLTKLPVSWTVGAILLWLPFKEMGGKVPVYRDLLQSILSLNKVLQGGGESECDPSENKEKKKMMLLKTNKKKAFYVYRLKWNCLQIF